jgi:catechol 2,3-dioxygenase-like lactoylglutathione lyase family enzyme
VPVATTNSRPSGILLLMDPISHVDLVVSDLEASLGFYRDLLRPLGYIRESNIVGERGERVTYLSRAAGGGSVGLRQCPSTGHTVAYDRYTVGVHHLAFSAPSRDVVDERWRWLIQQQALIESNPREYEYGSGYYAVFFYDPDGIKLEVVHEPSDADLEANRQR